METHKRLHENISALADGELAASEVELALAALGTPEGLAAWDAYHQIGHSVRSDHFGAELSPGFAARLARRLAAEDAAVDDDTMPVGLPEQPVAALVAAPPLSTALD